MLGNVVKFVIACCVLNHILTKVHGKLYLLQNEAAEDFDNVVEKDEDVNKRNVQVETSTLKPTSSISNHKRQSKLGNSKTIGLNHNSAEKVGPNSDYDMVLIRNEEPNRFYWFKKPNEGERDDPGSSDVDFEAVGNLIKDNTGNFGSDKTDKKNWNYNDFKKLHTMKEAEFKEKEHKNDEFRPNQLLDETQKPQRVRISLEMTVSVPDTTEMSDNNDQTADKSKSQGELGQKTDNSCVEGNSLERSTPQHIRVNLESGMRRAGDEGDCQRKIDTLKSELSKIRLVDDKKAYRAKKKSNHKRSIDNETLFIDPHMAIVKVLGKLRGRHKRVPAVTDKIQSIGLVNNQSEFYQANFKPFSKIIELLSNKSTAENFTYIPIIFVTFPPANGTLGVSNEMNETSTTELISSSLINASAVKLSSEVTESNISSNSTTELNTSLNTTVESITSSTLNTSTSIESMSPSNLSTNESTTGLNKTSEITTEFSNVTMSSNITIVTESTVSLNFCSAELNKSSNISTELNKTSDVTSNVTTSSNTTIESNTSLNTTIESNTSLNTTIESNTTSNTTIESNSSLNTTIESNTSLNTTIESNTSLNTTIESNTSLNSTSTELNTSSNVTTVSSAESNTTETNLSGSPNASSTVIASSSQNNTLETITTITSPISNVTTGSCFPNNIAQTNLTANLSALPNEMNSTESSTNEIGSFSAYTNTLSSIITEGNSLDKSDKTTLEGVTESSTSFANMDETASFRAHTMKPESASDVINPSSPNDVPELSLPPNLQDSYQNIPGVLQSHSGGTQLPGGVSATILKPADAIKLICSNKFENDTISPIYVANILLIPSSVSENEVPTTSELSLTEVTESVLQSTEFSVEEVSETMMTMMNENTDLESVTNSISLDMEDSASPAVPLEDTGTAAFLDSVDDSLATLAPKCVARSFKENNKQKLKTSKRRGRRELSEEFKPGLLIYPHNSKVTIDDKKLRKRFAEEEPRLDSNIMIKSLDDRPINDEIAFSEYKLKRNASDDICRNETEKLLDMLNNISMAPLPGETGSNLDVEYISLGLSQNTQITTASIPEDKTGSQCFATEEEKKITTTEEEIKSVSMIDISTQDPYTTVESVILDVEEVMQTGAPQPFQVTDAPEVEEETVTESSLQVEPEEEAKSGGAVENEVNEDDAYNLIQEISNEMSTKMSLDEFSIQSDLFTEDQEASTKPEINSEGPEIPCASKSIRADSIPANETTMVNMMTKEEIKVTTPGTVTSKHKKKRNEKLTMLERDLQLVDEVQSLLISGNSRAPQISNTSRSPFHRRSLLSLDTNNIEHKISALGKVLYWRDHHDILRPITEQHLNKLVDNVDLINNVGDLDEVDTLVDRLNRFRRTAKHMKHRKKKRKKKKKKKKKKSENWWNRIFGLNSGEQRFLGQGIQN